MRVQPAGGRPRVANSMASIRPIARGSWPMSVAPSPWMIFVMPRRRLSLYSDQPTSPSSVVIFRNE